MAWTSPRTWSQKELVTETLFNRQVRDNLTWLRDQFATGSGHDHDGADAPEIPWANLPAATFTTWVSGAQAVQWTNEGQSAFPHPNGYTKGPDQDEYEMVFSFDVPTTWAGKPVHIKQITFYGWNYYWPPYEFYFHKFWLRRSDLAGAYTDDVLSDVDIQNPAGGDCSGVIFAGDLALSDFPYSFVVRCETALGGSQSAYWRIYGLKVEWEA